MNGNDTAFPAENGSYQKGFTKQEWVLLEMTKAVVAAGYEKNPVAILDHASQITNQFFTRL